MARPAPIEPARPALWRGPTGLSNVEGPSWALCSLMA
jgi:hypothetical protein